MGVGGGFWRQTTHVGDAGREGKMGKSQSEGGASTYIYGLIFVLYAGIAVVLFIYMMHKRSKQQKSEESVESEGKDGAKASSSKPAKETSQAPTGEKSSAAKENAKKSQVDESEAKETTFVSPTEEEIKQLCEAPKAGSAKKKE